MQDRGSTVVPSSNDVTSLLQAWSNGDQEALDKLTPLVYAELHRLARRYMASERPGHTLQTTALVHEAYLKLIDCRRMSWRNRVHFFAVSAQVMRRVLVDAARARRSMKRGGDMERISLDEAPVVSRENAADMMALDDALKALEAID